MKTGILIQNGTGVTDITDGIEMVVTDGEDANLRHRLRLNSKRSGALHEKATKMYPLDPVLPGAKAPPTCLHHQSHLQPPTPYPNHRLPSSHP
jgi:hypothetical protein